MSAADALRSRAARARVLYAAGPAAATLAVSAVPPPGWTWGVALGGGVLAALAGAALPRRVLLGRALALGGVALLAAGMHETLRESPSAVVVFALGASALYAFMTAPSWDARRGAAARFGASAAAQAMLGLSALAWLDLMQREPHAASLAAAIAGSVAALYGVWRWQADARPSRTALALVLAPLAVGLGAGVFAFDAPRITASSVAATQLIAAALMPGEGEGASIWSRLLDHPARLLVGTFAVLCAAGTLALALPASAAGGHSVGLLDAAFTSVSAVCVTGLIVLDTPNAFGPLGQVLLLLLIQVGGLGIMTFYPLALSILGRRLSLKHERAIAGALNVDERQRLFGSVRGIVLVTFVSEGIGALVLTGCFLAHGDGLGTALWRGVFTSISAFCNAGFALQTDNLIPYQGDPIVLHTVALLITLGGLSPIAIFAFPRWVRGERVPLQPFLVLWTSAFLLVAGALLYALIEWNETLAGLSTLDRLHNAWFQSVTLRTAGFNSVDLTLASPATVTLMIVWMFIGGSPGGTAGGVKTTTAAVLVLTVLATLRGHTDPVAAARRIGRRTIHQAASVMTVSVLVVFAAVVALQLTQRMDPEVALFEVVSALGTVGLTIGGTPALDEVGKVIVMMCMFGGRVGPLTLLVFLGERQAPTEPVGSPQAEVDVG